MKILTQIILLFGLIVLSVHAENVPVTVAKSQTATAALNRDAICTRCHDESEKNRFCQFIKRRMAIALICALPLVKPVMATVMRM